MSTIQDVFMPTQYIHVNVVEGDGDWIAVKGVDARHPMIVMLHDTPFLKIRRHQQARSWLKKLQPEGFE